MEVASSPTHQRKRSRTDFYVTQVQNATVEIPLEMPPSSLRRIGGPSFVLVDAQGPSIAHSCVLIPVVIAFWWYWTKRTAQRAWASCREPQRIIDDDDSSWDEVNVQNDPSLRFVKWIHGSSTTPERQQRRRMRNLWRSRRWKSKQRIIDDPDAQQDLQSQCSYLSETTAMSWQYIPDVTGSVEIYSYTGQDAVSASDPDTNTAETVGTSTSSQVVQIELT